MLAFVLGGVLVGIFIFAIFAWLLPKINGMMLLKRHREARRRRFDDLCEALPVTEPVTGAQALIARELSRFRVRV
jgi:hypothetical protein